MDIRKKLQDFKHPLESLKIKDVGVVFIKRMSVREQQVYEYAVFGDSIKFNDQGTCEREIKQDHSTKVVVYLVAMTLCDENGELIFTTSDEDINILKDMDSKIVSQIALAARKLNSLDADEVKSELKNSGNETT